MLADVSAVAHIPDDLDDVAFAPLRCAGVTAFSALRNGGAHDYIDSTEGDPAEALRKLGGAVRSLPFPSTPSR